MGYSDRRAGMSSSLMERHAAATQTAVPFDLSARGAALFHGTNYLAPLFPPCPVVLTVHDLTVLSLPETHRWLNRAGHALLPALVRRIEEGGDPSDLPGVDRFDGHHLVGATPHEIIDPVAQLAPPDYTVFDLGAYRTRDLPILASRGCTGHCTFCNDHPAMGRFRARPGEAAWPSRDLVPRLARATHRLAPGRPLPRGPDRWHRLSSLCLLAPKPQMHADERGRDASHR